MCLKFEESFIEEYTKIIKYISVVSKCYGVYITILELIKNMLEIIRSNECSHIRKLLEMLKLIEQQQLLYI